MAQNYGENPSKKLRAYNGGEPYIFISYAHRDSDQVLPIIARMMDDGYRVWFDEGIDPGTEWDTFIAEHIGGCAYFIALMSENYLASDNCKDELSFVRDLGKQRLLIYLENVKLPIGMQMRLGRSQAIHKYAYSDELDFYEKLYDANGIRGCLSQSAAAPSHRSEDDEAERRRKEAQEAEQKRKAAEEEERLLKEIEEEDRKRKAIEEAEHKRKEAEAAAQKRKEEEEAKLRRKEAVKQLKRVTVGDHIFFGAYQQSRNAFAGNEPIEWLILDKKGGKILVISKDGLEAKSYNTAYKNATWETCSLRAWLNSIFIQSAFSADEQALIATVTVSPDKNPSHSTDPGKATQDKVFLLSIPEAKRYFPSDGKRECKATKYAKDHGMYLFTDWNCNWWLRTPGDDQDRASFVSSRGVIQEDGYRVSDFGKGVRPAMWIDLST